MSLLAPRAGTSVLVKASDEPWLTAHARSLTAVSAGSRLERNRRRLVPCGRARGCCHTAGGIRSLHRRCDLPAAWSKVVACVAAKARQAESEDTQP